MKKTLIAYFSRKGNNYVNGNIINLTTGNTEVVAKKIQSLIGGDLFEIKTTHSYSKDYHQCTIEAQKELREKARPKLTDHIPDIERYDTVCLGYPNWWGTMPMGVFTFLERYEFKGKVIAPFCTHEGSGMGKSESDIRKICPDAVITDGLAILGSSVNYADENIKKWLSKTGLL